jgi:hypothetical protein
MLKTQLPHKVVFVKKNPEKAGKADRDKGVTSRCNFFVNQLRTILFSFYFSRSQNPSFDTNHSG